MDSRRLIPLQTLADSREEQAARRLREYQRQFAEQEARLEEIRRYAIEYAETPPQAAVPLLVNRQAFLSRLKQAERFQEKAVEDARLAVEAERLKWLLLRREASVLEQLAGCYRSREQREEQRRDQRGIDELALRRFLAASPEEPR